MTRGSVGMLVLLVLAGANAAYAQQRPRPVVRTVVRQERFRISVNAGQQAINTPFAEEQRFDQYFEQGSFTLERPIAKALFYDAGVAVRVWRRLHAGAALSVFENSGHGDVTAQVPHPLSFNQRRTVNGQISDVLRSEVGQHVSLGWVIPEFAGLDLLLFGGPSVFTTEQRFVRNLTLSLDNEIYPFDTLAFPGAVTEQLREHIVGYHAGVDVTWRFADRAGVGVLLRYMKGKDDFTPTGGTPVGLEVGGLHAGVGLRVMF